MSVLLGNGDGTFQPQVTYAVGSDPDAIVAGDFNGDGRTDLAVANQATTTTVSVLLGNGDGTFQPQVTYAVGSYPVAIVAGDFNGDGRTDLAVANSAPTAPSRCCWATATARSSPRSPTRWGRIPTAIVAGDFNGDGRTDLAVANYDRQHRVGAAGQRRRHVPAPGHLRGGVDARSRSWRVTSTATAALDLAVANYSDNTVSVLLGNGDGTFQPQVTYAVGSDPTSIVAGDFNGDGRTDLAVANSD